MCACTGSLAASVAGLLDWLMGGETSVAFAVTFGVFISAFLLIMSLSVRQRPNDTEDRVRGTPSPLTGGERLALGACALAVVLSLVVINQSQVAAVLVLGILLDLAAGVGVVLVVVHHHRSARQVA